MNSKQNLAYSDEEKKILKLKYASKQIGKMNDQEVKAWSKALLMKVHVITGWVIPADDFLLTILKDQFEKKLIEDYDMLNTDEIEYAFRSKGTIIKDWGKEMNLNLIDQVLQPYLSDRLNASGVEEKLKYVPPPQIIYSDEQITNMRREEIETAFQAMKQGKFPLIFDYWLEILQEDGLLRPEENLHTFFVNRLNEQQENIYVKG